MEKFEEILKLSFFDSIFSENNFIFLMFYV